MFPVFLFVVFALYTPYISPILAILSFDLIVVLGKAKTLAFSIKDQYSISEYYQCSSDRDNQCNSSNVPDCIHFPIKKKHTILWVVKMNAGNNDIFMCCKTKFTSCEAQIGPQ